MGPVLDEAYGNDVCRQLEDLPGVYLVPSLSAPQLYAAIQSSCAVINTSISEGQCGVILEVHGSDPFSDPFSVPSPSPSPHPPPPDLLPLVNVNLAYSINCSHGYNRDHTQAMVLGKAVIARSIPQNAALIVHGENGLLFDTAEEFCRVAASLMEGMGIGMEHDRNFWFGRCGCVDTFTAFHACGLLLLCFYYRRCTRVQACQRGPGIHRQVAFLDGRCGDGGGRSCVLLARGPALSHWLCNRCSFSCRSQAVLGADWPWPWC